MAALGKGLGLLVELRADWLQGGGGWTGGGVVVPVSSGAARSDHFRHETILFNVVARQHSAKHTNLSSTPVSHTCHPDNFTDGRH